MRINGEAAVSHLTKGDAAEISKEEFEKLGEEARLMLQEKFASKFRKYFKFSNESLKAALKAAVKEWCEDSGKAEAKYGHISGWDTSEVTKMGYLLAAYSNGTGEVGKEFNDDISRWNVARVENMHQMFAYAKSSKQDLSG
ncbi:hypothetical protein TL16_g08972 [Triparma laevis f. inornata]|uniref:Uncharacterized protein n=1 Tax=Triparma laevis f. inornata TaxID=1714386 RepID=A0A9W7B3R9_9STRA|nr:hypothetical protein TL16_g08972 [Triparma laevis f. inornata]